MYLVCYLAHEQRHITAVQDRLALAKPPIALVTAHSVPEVINQIQTLPVSVILVDLTWPRAIWMQLATDLRQLHPQMPLLAFSPGPTEEEWWSVADDLLRLDEGLEPFLHRLKRVEHHGQSSQGATTDAGFSPAKAIMPAPMLNTATSIVNETPSLLENPQFRQFAEMFSGLEEATLVELFAGWVQQACQTSRAVILLRDQGTGLFSCRAQRGLPSTLVPYCAFPQTAPLCRWLASTGRILLKDGHGSAIASDILTGLDLMQAVAAVPIVRDGQLVGILGIGARLIGQHYSASELEALFTLGGQIATALHHCQMHRTVQAQQELTAHMLSVMPTGTLVLGQDQCIAFVNASAAAMVGKSRSALQGMDLRVLPSPLGDLAFHALAHREDLPPQELTISTTGMPVAVTGFVLATTPPSALLLLEDLSAEKRADAERERRVNLEVINNVLHYLAHELRNPLVALSTFSTLAPKQAGDPDFQHFCESVLQHEIGRVSLILEQLLVLTNDVEFQFGELELAPLIENVTNTEQMRSEVVVSLPISLPTLLADGQRLETALTCILRTLTHLSSKKMPATLQVTTEDDAVLIRIEVATSVSLTPEWLLNPWQQFMGNAEQHIDLGLATAQYILHQHAGTLSVSMAESILSVLCRLPIRQAIEERREGWYGAKEGSHSR
ncbi:MAG TPA: GAF domain-containing protein [Armatimonadota bacterium]